MYELRNTFLKGVTEEKYLGVLISNNLSWSPHIQKVSTAANQTLGFLRGNLKGSPRNLKKLEKSQKKAARWLRLSSHLKRNNNAFESWPRIAGGKTSYLAAHVLI